MKIGIVGYQGSGKSTLFHWLTGQVPDPALAHASQSAMATIPDRRVERLKDQLRKPRANKEKDQEELDLLVPLLAELEAGKPLHSYPLTAEQRKAIKSFQLFSEKPRLIVVNTADDEDKPQRFQTFA